MTMNLTGSEIVLKALADQNVEVVFGYPGIGYALYRGVISADYNLIMGVTLLSIIGIATASLIIDLIYPLFDPRVRYK